MYSDTINKYRSKCGSCLYLNIKNRTGCKYPCSKVYGLHSIDEDKCSRHELDEERNYDELERIEKNDCYITTILCEILGFEDNCEILQIMRAFRHNILQKDIRYLGILYEYDLSGPIIANNLKNDENALWIAKELLEHYIKPIILFIKKNDYNSAVVLYINMTNLLKDSYAIGDIFEYDDDYDHEKGGHGRVYKKVKVNA